MAITTTPSRLAQRLLCAGAIAASVGSLAFSQASKAAAPLVTAVRPDHLEASGSEQALAVLGQSFVPGITVSITDPAGTAQDIPASAVSDVKPASMHLLVTLRLDGDYTIVVTNPAGTPSNAFGFHVGPRSPATGPR